LTLVMTVAAADRLDALREERTAILDEAARQFDKSAAAHRRIGHIDHPDLALWSDRVAFMRGGGELRALNTKAREALPEPHLVTVE
jgi:hypothetical protein